MELIVYSPYVQSDTGRGCVTRGISCPVFPQGQCSLTLFLMQGNGITAPPINGAETSTKSIIKYTVDVTLALSLKMKSGWLISKCVQSFSAETDKNGDNSFQLWQWFLWVMWASVQKELNWERLPAHFTKAPEQLSSGNFQTSQVQIQSGGQEVKGSI